jgi:hypothetical protein
MAKTVSINVNINTKKAIKSIADLNNEIGDTIVTVSDLRMTVDTLQQELESTEVGTERWNELKSALINANTELKNYELGIEALDNEQVASEIKSVVGGLTDMAGGFVLVGASGKKMEELVQIFAMVEGASRIVTGAMEGFNSMMKLQNTITQRVIALKETMTAATLGQGVAAKVASVGMGILNAVMAINPVFLLIAGLAALVAGLAIFFTSTNDAAEAQEKLNREMEANQNLQEVSNKQSKRKQDLDAQEISNQQKLLEGNIKLLESKKELTDAEEEQLKQQKTLLEELKGEEQQILTDAAVKAVKDNAQGINDSFASIRKAIEATDYEDAGGDNLEAGYASLTNQLQTVQTSFMNLKRAQESGQISNEDYLASIQRLETEGAKIVNTYKDVQVELGADSDEGELFQRAIDGATDLQAKFSDAADDAKTLIETLSSGEAEKALREQENALEELTKQQEAADKAEKDREERVKKYLERRKKLLAEINSILSRQEKALQDLQKTRIQLVDDEFEQQRKLAEFAYGSQREQLIKGAIAREKGLLEEKFVNGRISEQQYRDSIEEITKNGVDNLLEEEVKLLEAKKELLDKTLEDIDESERLELESRKVFLEQRDVVEQEGRKTKLQMLKEEAQFVASQTITDEVELQKRLLEINKQFLEREVQQVRDTQKELIDARKAQYEIDIQDKELSVEEKKLLEEEYNRDIVQINADAQTEIVGLYEETKEAVKESTFVLTEQQKLIFDTVVNGITQSLQIINDALQESAMRAEAERENNFNKEQEGLNQLLANKTLSQEQFDQKSKELEQKKRVEETKAKRKQFKVDKANNIIQAIISTAQSVLQGLASAPPPVGAILGAINGALGAAQIGVISSQQFRAARGGVVPGSPSNVDSVSSLLAPGEMVINSTSAGMFGNLLSAVNQVGGGIPLTPNTPPPTQFNQPSPTFRDNGQQSVVRAYVVETDVTQKQEKVSRIQRSSEF